MEQMHDPHSSKSMVVNLINPKQVATPLQVGLLTWALPPEKSGLSRAALEIAHAIGEAGADVRVFTLDRSHREQEGDIEIIGCPIIREEDGLAKSSRNTYLNTQERSAALCLSRAVRTGQQIIQTGMDAEQVLAAMRAVIEAEPLAKIDYISMVDALTMQPVERVDRNVLVAMAVYIGKTRLIDNFSYEVSL